MNNTKKLISCILCLVIMSSLMWAYADELDFELQESQEVLYNYKISFENASGFNGDGYTYCGGNAGGHVPQDPLPPKPTMIFASDGKYGNAFKLTYHGFYIIKQSDRFGATFVRPLSDGITIGSGETKLSEYMKSVKTIAFWAKAPYSPHVGTRTRKFQFKLQTNISTYECWINLNNTGEWQYIKIPIELLRVGGRNITQDLDRIQSYELAFSIPYAWDYFGREPSMNDNTWENPWIEPLSIDELVFDRSTEDIAAITPPSPGEEAQASDATLSDIIVDGKSIVNFDEIKDDDILELNVLSSYTDETISGISIEGIPSCKSSTGTTQVPYYQIRTGATVKWIPPTSFSGTGRFIITSANGRHRKEYEIKFVQKHTLILHKVEGIELSTPLSAGVKNLYIPYDNQSSEETFQVSAIAIVREKATGKVVSVGYGQNMNILPNQKGQINLTAIQVPEIATNYKLSCYVWDGILSGNPLMPSVLIGQ